MRFIHTVLTLKQNNIGLEHVSVIKLSIQMITKQNHSTIQREGKTLSTKLPLF